MYRSLKKVCPSFRLFVFAFDDDCASLMRELALPEVTIITLAEFEDSELIRVKSSRTLAEYCWTCTASTILYCLSHFDIDHCTYLDSDLFFYQNPQVMIDEMGNNDILITPHWFDENDDNSEEVGRDCVQFVTAKNSPNALNIITKWRDECLEWCYSRHEDGKFGDQKYLDKWPEVYSGVCVSKNMGGGVAPWNMRRYSFYMIDGQLNAIERKTRLSFSVVFFHFHFLYVSSRIFLHKFSFDTYSLDNNCSQLTFFPYCDELRKSFKVLKHLGASNKVLGILDDNTPWRNYFIQCLKRVWSKDYSHYLWI